MQKAHRCFDKYQGTMAKFEINAIIRLRVWLSFSSVEDCFKSEKELRKMIYVDLWPLHVLHTFSIPTYIYAGKLFTHVNFFKVLSLPVPGAVGAKGYCAGMA